MKWTSSRGFTLIELMIVVVVIGILAGIAYPSYQQWITKSRRGDAMSALTNVAARLEKFYSQCGHFAKDLVGGTGFTCGTSGNAFADGKLGLTSANSIDGNYSLAIVAGALAGSCSGAGAKYTCGYTLTATPIAGSPQAGNGPLRLDSMGVKQWDSANNGSYGANWSK
jgi:type IV pilus assembly protein PilE